MKFAHHQVCKGRVATSDEIQELEKLIECNRSSLASEGAEAHEPTSQGNNEGRHKWQLYVVGLLCFGGVLLVYAAATASNSQLVKLRQASHQNVVEWGASEPGHAHSSARYYSIQPDGVNNVIECAPRGDEGQEEGSGRTLFIVINSRAQNFERRRKLRASWLNAANLERELCARGHRRPSLRFATTVPPTPNGLADAPTINQSNRVLAHKARIGRIEWLFALGHVRGGGGGDQNLTSGGEKETELILARERSQFNDLLMLPLVDSYRNMTLKHLAIFEWLLGRQHQHQNQGHIKQSQSDRASSITTTTTTTTVPLLIKADDDAQLDLAQMISKYVIETTGHAPAAVNSRPLLMCARFEAGTPVTRFHDHGNKTAAASSTSSPGTRKNENKWALTRSEWPEDTFPAYCSGLAYLATMDLVELLQNAARRTRRAPLWIDDVYLTGVLLGSLPRDSYRVIKLNSYYCYTRAQRLHRESLEPGLECMAYEDQEP